MIHDPAYFERRSASSEDVNHSEPLQDMYSGRTSPEFSTPHTVTILPKSLPRFCNSGRVTSHGECWTRATPETGLLSDGGGCSLSAILLENVPDKYSLSARAAGGILRRIMRNGKVRNIPPAVVAILRERASKSTDSMGSSA